MNIEKECRDETKWKLYDNAMKEHEEMEIIGRVNNLEYFLVPTAKSYSKFSPTYGRLQNGQGHN